MQVLFAKNDKRFALCRCHFVTASGLVRDNGAQTPTRQNDKLDRFRPAEKTPFLSPASSFSAASLQVSTYYLSFTTNIALSVFMYG